MTRYSITLLSLLTAVLFACTQAAADGPARVLLGGRELLAAPPSVESGGEVYISPGMLESLGASYSAVESGEMVSVTGANGQVYEIACRQIDDTVMLPLKKVAEALGARAEWDASTRAARLTSRVTAVEFVDGELKIKSTLPVASTIKEWKNASRIIIDIHGSELATEAREVYVGGADVQRIRLGQPSEDTARVVVDLNRVVRFQRISSPIASEVVVELGSSAGANDASGEPEAGVPVGSLTGISVEPIDDKKLIVRLSTAGRVASQTSLQADPLSLNVEMLNATLAMSDEDIAVDHPLVKLIRIENRPERFHVLLILNTTRFVAYDVDVSDGQIVVSVMLPKGAGGTLAGKTIVIDPGHGGRQTGTRKGGCVEKHINLQIAKRVHRMLLDEGVNAVLTRDGDHSLTSDLLEDLQARPRIAAKLGADMFISIHCNSGNRATRGTETYYHMSAQSGRALAHAVQSHIIRATGMVDRRARSDYSVWPGKGFAVLRYATIPAILIETGYLSNRRDRACLISRAFQEKLAKGIVNGIKAYVEGSQ